MLVLGESAAMTHHSIYGYARPTTPFLSSRRDQLLVIARAVSPAVTSADSIEMMLTSMSNNERRDMSSAISVINVANAASFTTYWLSNQGKLGKYDTKTSVLAGLCCAIS